MYFSAVTSLINIASLLLAISSVAALMIAPLFAKWVFNQLFSFLKSEAQFLKSKDDFERYKFVKDIELKRLEKQYEKQIKSDFLSDAQANALYDVKNKIDTLTTQFERPKRLRKAFQEFQELNVVQPTETKQLSYASDYFVYESESYSSTSQPQHYSDLPSPDYLNNSPPPDYWDDLPPPDYYDYGH